MKTQVEKDGKVWKRMTFKENKVWLAMDQDGKPIVESGKVLIKYRLEHDYEYWVHQKNIRPVDASIPKKKKSRKRTPKIRENGATRDPDSDGEKARDDAICIYADGASSGNPGPSGIGVVLRYRNHEKEISRYIGIATNNIAELEAIRAGLLAMKNRGLPVRIFTDSSYAYGMLALGWKARKNQEMIRSIKKTIEKFTDLKIIKVKGHAGIEGNEKADALATSALKKTQEKNK